MDPACLMEIRLRKSLLVVTCPHLDLPVRLYSRFSLEKANLEVSVFLEDLEEVFLEGFPVPFEFQVQRIGDRWMEPRRTWKQMP
jgi:hypothetical protein